MPVLMHENVAALNVEYFHMITNQKYLLFSVKLPFSKRIYLKDSLTIFFKHVKIAF